VRKKLEPSEAWPRVHLGGWAWPARERSGRPGRNVSRCCSTGYSSTKAPATLEDLRPIKNSLAGTIGHRSQLRDGLLRTVANGLQVLQQRRSRRSLIRSPARHSGNRSEAKYTAWLRSRLPGAGTLSIATLNALRSAQRKQMEQQAEDERQQREQQQQTSDLVHGSEELKVAWKELPKRSGRELGKEPNASLARMMAGAPRQTVEVAAPRMWGEK
jgi:hypothetical protein